MVSGLIRMFETDQESGGTIREVKGSKKWTEKMTKIVREGEDGKEWVGWGKKRRVRGGGLTWTFLFVFEFLVSLALVSLS